MKLIPALMGSDNFVEDDHGLHDDVAGKRQPYFGMTGTQLNIWVTVACTTAMALFGIYWFMTFPGYFF